MSSSERLDNSGCSQKPSDVEEGNSLGSYSIITPAQLPGVLTEVVDIPPQAEAGVSNERHHESSDLSDGEGTDVEIENVVGFEQKLNPLSPTTSDVQYAGMCRGKRTTISIMQKGILEQFFQAGMNSASMAHIKLMAAAAEKTGLDIGVIKNWIRNRRRPAALKSAEKIANIFSLNHPSSIPPPSLTTPSSVSIPPISTSPVFATLINKHPTSLTHNQPSNAAQPSVVPAAAHNSTSVSSLHSAPVAHNQIFTTEIPGVVSPPPAKRLLIDKSTSVSIIQPASSQINQSVHVPQVTNASPLLSQNSSPILVKVRISEGSDQDFIEVEVPSLTYQSLLLSVCEELELAPSKVTKIRKLPNVLVRKDKDVQRLKEGQELEVITHDSC